MDGTATRELRKVTRPAAASVVHHHLSEHIVAEILLRLPAKSVIRFRAVCTAWCRILTDPNFIAAHSRLRPAEFVFYTRLDAEPRGSRLAGSGLVDIALDTLPIFSSSSGDVQRQRRIRYSKKSPMTAGSCLLLSSCNGVLLLKRDDESYLLCNPVTRQWAELPALSAQGHLVREYAFYFHEPSSEYRLWCHRGMSTTTTIGWTGHVLSTGAAEPRRVQMPHAEVARRISDLLVTVPVLLHGRLHWPPPLRHISNTEEVMTREIVAFDTLSETFQVMAGPPTTTANLVKLFHMDGLLAVADLGETMHISLWFLNAGRWECRHRFATPSRNHFDLLFGIVTGDGEGNVVLGMRRCFFVYNVRRKTLRMACSVDTPQNDDVMVSRHVFRESLVQQPYFSARFSADLRLIHLWC